MNQLRNIIYDSQSELSDTTATKHLSINHINRR